MVSTRGHPQEFPEPDLSPTKSTTSTPGRPRKRAKWAHTPSNLTLLWLFISLPLVTWDAGYVLLRPLSMPGGKYHWPLWVPYELYGTVDYIYGQLAWDEKDGFTGAQTFLNVIETLMYAYYLYIVLTHGRPSKAQGRGAPRKSIGGYWSEQRYVDGKYGALAVLLCYATAVMTVSKTVLYWMVEYYNGYRHIGHNNFQRLFVLWIIPNGAWIILPSYIIYVTAAEILQGLAIAAGEGTPPSDKLSLVKIS